MKTGYRFGGLLSAFLGLALLTSPARADVRIGSFVDGERTMYVEIDRLVAGEEYTLTIRNLPEGSRGGAVFFSEKLYPMDLEPLGIPGVLGPDLVYGGLIRLARGQKTLKRKCPANAVGKGLYIQAYVRTKKGGRLSSMVRVHPRQADFSEDDPAVQFPIPLITQETAPNDRSGWDRVNGHVRVGIPLPRGHVSDISGVPALTLDGPVSRGQFSTLATWPDGSVKWALVEYFTDLAAGASHQRVSVDHGSGNFGGPDVATSVADGILVDTGRVQFKIRGDTRNLFQYLRHNGKDVIDARDNRLHLFDADDHSWTFHGQGARLRRNGPVRAEIQVDGVFTRSSSVNDDDRVYVRLYVDARQGESAVRVQTSLRNTSIRFPEHLLFRGFGYRATLADAEGLEAALPVVSLNGDKPGNISGSIEGGGLASFESGFTVNTEYLLQTTVNSSLYHGFVQRVDGKDEFAIEGCRVRLGEQYHTGDSGSDFWSHQTEYADSTFLQVNAASGRGLLMSVELGSRYWPISLDAEEDGAVTVGLLPHKRNSDSYDYPLTYGTSETRTFYLIPQAGPSAAPQAVAARLDYPLTARAPLWAYNQSGAWAWRLVSHNNAVAFSDHAEIERPHGRRAYPTRTVYRYAGGTGGSNNNWGSTRKFNEWLRQGHAGALLWASSEAEYKVDKTACTIDDGSALNAREVRNPDVDATSHGKFYDGSKHTFFQSVPDVGYTRGDTYLLDSARHLSETFLSPKLTVVQPGGSFVAGYYGAVGNSSIAALNIAPHPALEDNLYTYMDQWVNLVFKRDNEFGVDTYTKGWQAAVGTPIDTPANPDGYFVAKAGKGSYWKKYGYMVQVWSHTRHTANVYLNFMHYLSEHRPGDPLIDKLRQRGPDIYHFIRRGFPEDFATNTGEHYIVDLFNGDADSDDVDPFAEPGDYTGSPSQTAYTLTGAVVLYLMSQQSESAYSYGVELCRSMDSNNWDNQTNDPVMNEFMYRYLQHHGLLEIDL